MYNAFLADNNIGYAMTKGGLMRMFRRDTGETLACPNADFVSIDDFPAGISTHGWTDLIVGAGGPDPLALTATHGGWRRFTHDNDNEAEQIGLYGGDVLTVDIKKGTYAECRFKRPAGDVTTAQRVVVGMATATATDMDTITAQAWVSLTASMVAILEADDGVTDYTISSGQTLVHSTNYIVGIDFGDINDVRFQINGTEYRGTTTTTFNLSGISTNNIWQPYVVLQKASGTTTTSLDVDYFKIFSRR